MTACLHLPYAACIQSLLLLPDFQIHFQQNPVQKHSLHKLCLVVHSFFFLSLSLSLSLSLRITQDKNIWISSLSLSHSITQDKSITYICSVVNPFSLSLPLSHTHTRWKHSLHMFSCESVSLSLSHTHSIPQDKIITEICLVVNWFSLSPAHAHADIYVHRYSFSVSLIQRIKVLTQWFHFHQQIWCWSSILQTQEALRTLSIQPEGFTSCTQFSIRQHAQLHKMYRHKTKLRFCVCHVCVCVVM